jgi:hypothetical protein
VRGGKGEASFGILFANLKGIDERRINMGLRTAEGRSVGK